MRLWRGRRRLRYQQVLTTLYRLAVHHADPVFRSEQGMLDTYHGHRTRAALRQLQKRGLVEWRSAPPDEPGGAKHWVLTASGFEEAKRILDSLGQEER